MNLPDKFLDNMKLLLGNEFPLFLDSFAEKNYKGLRTNSLKIESGDFIKLSGFNLKRIPYIHNGFIYENENPAKDSYYHAGLYYLQEPSAMLPADRLPIDEGDYVLDLCAAPGGKATELLGKLKGTGLIYANDISATRAKALLKNIELTGAKNFYVTAETPDKLSESLPHFFDKILCDVPCSGEGMFRKDPSLISSYNKCDIKNYQDTQRKILTHAYKMLKPGGYIMYSTCTFNLCENEENIAWFLDEFDDMSLEKIDGFEGFTKGFLGLDKCVRVFPHKMIGEGHFLALMKKDEANHYNNCNNNRNYYNDKKYDDKFENKCIDEPANLVDITLHPENTHNNIKKRDDIMFKVGNAVYIIPDTAYKGYRKGLRYLRTGLYVGDEVNTKSGGAEIKYSQSYAMALCSGNTGVKTSSGTGFNRLCGDFFDNFIKLTHDDMRVEKYLKGETLFLNDTEQLDKGYALVLVDDFPLGFAKYDGMKLKNLYNPAWRLI